MTAYWVSIYQETRDEQKMAAYAALAGPALTSAGGRLLTGGLPEKVYEGGLNQRVVIIEFDSLEAATAAHDSPAIRRRLRFWAMASAAKSGSSPGCNTRPQRVVPDIELAVAGYDVVLGRLGASGAWADPGWTVLGPAEENADRVAGDAL